jgi:hypothetical protein
MKTSILKGIVLTTLLSTLILLSTLPSVSANGGKIWDSDGICSRRFLAYG